VTLTQNRHGELVVGPLIVALADSREAHDIEITLPAAGGAFGSKTVHFAMATVPDLVEALAELTRYGRCIACHGAGGTDWPDAFGEDNWHPCSQCDGGGWVLR
jgi:hypothetical protein